jgi:hypothetical protein
VLKLSFEWFPHCIILDYDLSTPRKKQRVAKQPWFVVRKRTTPTERWPLLGELECQLLRIEECRVVKAAVTYVSHFQFSRSEPILFLPSSSSFILTRVIGTRSRHNTLRKSSSTWNWTQDLWVWSQELWPLDHRGGPSSGNCNYTLNDVRQSHWPLGLRRELSISRVVGSNPTSSNDVYKR